MTVVRTRYAPSPTGLMHVGNLRTALYEYLIARSLGGQFVLRIEDTDQERLVEGATDIIYRTLAQVGLRHDEGPDIGGPCGPYVQSERLGLYKPYAQQLVAEDKAYPCFCSKARLDEIRAKAEAEGNFAGGYDRHCRDLPAEEAAARIAKGETYVIRQKMPLTGTTIFQDAVYGEIAVDNRELEDQDLLKSDGFPTYNFANVVDDHSMKITHVVRGSEYLSSTPKYNLLYEAFGWPVPTYVHLPLILGQDGKKLSKRHGATSFEDLAAEGYLPAAIVNYIALLGWCPKDNTEVFSLADLEKVFAIDGISKSPSVFDYDKLTWFNAEYIRSMAPAQFLDLIRPQLWQAFGSQSFHAELLAEILQPRVTRLNQVAGMVAFLAQRQAYDVALFANKKSKTDPALAAQVLQEALAVLEALPVWDRQRIHDALIALAADRGMKNGQVMWPVRIAISGQEVTPGGAIEILAILGKDESLARIRIALEKLQGALA
jgi:glutamyl-tRNA synthetase